MRKRCAAMNYGVRPSISSPPRPPRSAPFPKKGPLKLRPGRIWAIDNLSRRCDQTGEVLDLGVLCFVETETILAQIGDSFNSLTDNNVRLVSRIFSVPSRWSRSKGKFDNYLTYAREAIKIRKASNSEKLCSLWELQILKKNCSVQYQTIGTINFKFRNKFDNAICTVRLLILLFNREMF